MGGILEKNRLNLHYRSCIRMKDKMYFSEAFFNGLFEMDLNDFSVKFIGHFSGENKSKMLLHGGRAVQYKDVIYFFPSCIKQVHYYNVVTGVEHSIAVPILDNEEFVIIGIVQRKNRVWFFSAEASRGVFVLDMAENSIKKADALTILFSKYKSVTNFIELAKEGNAFTYCTSESALLEIDVEKEIIQEHKISIGDKEICSINYCEGMFYFIDAVSGDLYEWGWHNKYLRKFSANNVEMSGGKGVPFSNCCFVNGNIYMIPLRSEYVMKIMKDDGIMERAFEYPKDFQRIKTVNLYYEPALMSSFEVIHNEIWFYPFGSNQLLIYDTKTNQLVGKKVTLDIDRVFPYEGIVYEISQESLDYLFHNIGKSKTSSAAEDREEGTRIYHETN